MFFPASEWFAAFVLTLAVEIPIASFILRPVEPHLLRLIALIVYANLATHVAVWYVFTQLAEPGTLSFTLAAETWAVVVEAVFYRLTIRSVTSRRAAGVALVANGASFVIGRLIGRAWLGLVS